jgi:hypothetical protein
MISRITKSITCLGGFSNHNGNKKQQRTLFCSFFGDSKPVFKMPFEVTKNFGRFRGHFKNRSRVTPEKSDDTET